jgi:hypothetical protein
MTKTCEIIPSWAGVLPLLVEAAQSNSFQARRDAMAELTRMAELADRYVSFVKIAEHKRTQKEQTNGR